MTERTYLIADPQHEYALELIGAIAQEFGLKPVCVYLNSRSEVFLRPHFKQLRSKNVLEHCYLDRTTPAALASYLLKKYDILGIVPYFEQSIAPLMAVAQHLPMVWNEPRVMQRFRDKYALKQFLREAAPSIEVGMSRLVTTAAQVLEQPLPERFVIKPNDGFANRDVAFFQRATAASSVPAYFQANSAASHAAYVLEEQFMGTEYAVNGQMDAQGEATIINVTRYARCAGNGKENLYFYTHHVRQSDEGFAALSSYARAVMQASGLRRCPFHMELMLTSAGPRLIEVAARFGGTRYAYMANGVHGPSFNYFRLAAHYYLSSQAAPATGLNWSHYDQTAYVHADGIAPQTARIYRLAGKTTIEQMPEFRMWVIEPKVGNLMQRTIDLYSIPYSFQLQAPGSQAALTERAAWARQQLQINQHVSTVRRLQVFTQARLQTLQYRLRWQAHQLGHRCRGLIAR